MKKGIVFMLGVFFSSMLLAQVDVYKVEASKSYENRTKTVYLSLNADIDAETAKMIENALEAQSDIHKFSFYAAPNYQKCMFTVDNAVFEDEIIALINEVIYDAKPDSYYNTEFINQSFFENYYKVVFKLNKKMDAEIVQQIHLALKESRFITDVNSVGDMQFEIFSSEKMYPEQVNHVLSPWNVGVNEASIKQK